MAGFEIFSGFSMARMRPPKRIYSFEGFGFMVCPLRQAARTTMTNKIRAIVTGKRRGNNSHAPVGQTGIEASAEGVTTTVPCAFKTNVLLLSLKEVAG